MGWDVPRAGGDVAGVAFDAGLRSYMLSIYNYMCSAVLLTGIVALAWWQRTYCVLTTI